MGCYLFSEKLNELIVNKIRKTKLKTLFISFSKIGLFTFGGGYAMIPIIEREIVERRKWIEKSQFLELLTLAQTAPGPLALNTAVFVGYKICRFRGALASVCGIVIPSFIIILIIAIFFASIKDNEVVIAAFKGIRPAVIALILTPIFGLVKGMEYYKIALAIAAALAVWLLGVSPIAFIILGALVGVIHVWYINKKIIQ